MDRTRPRPLRQPRSSIALVSDDATIVTTISTSVIEVTMTADNQNPQTGRYCHIFRSDGENNGTATAKNVVIVSPIANNTTYVPESMMIMSESRTDAADGDSSDYNVTATLMRLHSLGRCPWRSIRLSLLSGGRQ
ncbi:MAG: hypothetical protein U5N26_11415 [Candidatus Marinimicrobia bacterium]|nr:hypothetical protein [Candidatus Neomarinimicrobiota bacterium]